MPIHAQNNIFGFYFLFLNIVGEFEEQLELNFIWQRILL